LQLERKNRYIFRCQQSRQARLNRVLLQISKQPCEANKKITRLKRIQIRHYK